MAKSGTKSIKKRRVVITGLGVIAPNGIGKDAFWKALKEGKSRKNGYYYGNFELTIYFLE